MVNGSIVICTLFLNEIFRSVAYIKPKQITLYSKGVGNIGKGEMGKVIYNIPTGIPFPQGRNE